MLCVALEKNIVIKKWITEAGLLFTSILHWWHDAGMFCSLVLCCFGVSHNEGQWICVLDFKSGEANKDKNGQIEQPRSTGFEDFLQGIYLLWSNYMRCQEWSLRWREEVRKQKCYYLLRLKHEQEHTRVTNSEMLFLWLVWT